MTYLLLQTFLLLLASYFLGAFLACMAKRVFFGAGAEMPEEATPSMPIEVPLQPPVVVPPQPLRARAAASSMPPVTPRAIDPVQPKIEVLRRPEPRPAPAVLDPSRFERALIGPDPNEGIPRVAVVELRAAVLEPVTDIYQPPQPPAPPPPLDELPPLLPVAEQATETLAEEVPTETAPEEDAETKLRPGGLAARLRDATTAAAAGAVAAAKAAAAASVAFPGMLASSRTPTEADEPSEDRKGAPPEEAIEPAPPTAVSEESRDEAADEPGQHFEEPTAASTSEAVGNERLADVTAATELPPAAPEVEPQVEPENSSPQPASEPEPETEPEPEPEQEPEPEPRSQSEAKVEPVVPVVPAAAIEGGDDLQRIRAIDAQIEQALKAQGINYFEHIAGWSASDVRRIGQELEIPGRIEREQWVEQAQILAKGGETYYSRNRRAMLKASAEAAAAKGGPSADSAPSAGADATNGPARASVPAVVGGPQSGLTGVAAASQGRSVAEMAAAAAAAIAASSASVTRGLKPIEPISPLSKVDPKISMPARITDAIREKESASANVEAPEETAPADAAGGGPSDDLKRIRGIGVLIEKRLNAMGIRRYDQIANWTSGDIDRVSRMLEFKGRIERESWVEQARILASGGQTEFSRRVDRGEVDMSRET